MSDARLIYASPAGALREAVRRAGGQKAMGGVCGVSQQAVGRWLANGKPLPGEHVLAVEAATGLSRHDLRPDLYPQAGGVMETVETPSLFARLGGIPSLAAELGLPIAEVLRWQHERRIPSERQPAVLRLATRLNVGVTAEDVIFPFPEDREAA